MASGPYNISNKLAWGSTWSIIDGTHKIMLVTSAYVFDPDHEFVTNTAGDSTDPLFNELNATLYTGGFAGSSRFAPSITIVQDDSTNKSRIFVPNQTWPTLGGGVNDTAAAIIIWTVGTSDADSTLDAYIDINDQTTNGTDFIVNLDQTNGVVDLFSNV